MDPSSVMRDVPRLRGKRRMARAVYHPAVVSALETVFQETPFPDPRIQAELSQRLGVTGKRIQGWFHNRRYKERSLPYPQQHPQVRIRSRPTPIIENPGEQMGLDFSLTGVTSAYSELDLGRLEAVYCLEPQPNEDLINALAFEMHTPKRTLESWFRAQKKALSSPPQPVATSSPKSPPLVAKTPISSSLSENDDLKIAMQFFWDPDHEKSFKQCHPTFTSSFSIRSLLEV